MGKKIAGSFRERYFPFFWAVLYPVRLYLRYFPVPQGKGMLLRNMVFPLFPSDGVEFDVKVPGNGVVSLCYRETLGWSSLLYGLFEEQELKFTFNFLHTGQVAMDIGANVGLFSVVLGKAVGMQGTVISFDPVPENVRRLRTNMSKNGISTDNIFEVALGEKSGRLELNLSADTAYSSFLEPEHGFGNEQTISVEVRTLDEVWDSIARPHISFIKIDVEGTEVNVINGGKSLLSTCHPALLIEANNAERLEELKQSLSLFGYIHQHPEGFLPHNHLFIVSGK